MFDLFFHSLLKILRNEFKLMINNKWNNLIYIEKNGFLEWVNMN